MILKVSKSHKSRLLEIKVNDNYVLNPGDKIYITNNVDVKKRDVDKWLKDVHPKVKRVSKLKDADKIFDLKKWNNLPTLIDVENRWELMFRGKKLWYENYIFNKEYVEHVKKHLSISEQKEVIHKHWRGGDCIHVGSLSYYFINGDYDKKIASIKLPSNEKDITVEKLINTPFYNGLELKKKVDDYILKNKFDSKSVDIEKVIKLLSTSDPNNAELAIKIMSEFNMRQYYSELLTLYFSEKMKSKSQLLLGGYLRKDSLISNMGLIKGGHYYHFNYDSLENFKKLLSMLKTENLPINRDFIIKTIFDI